MIRTITAIAATALIATGAAAASFSGTFAKDNGKAGFYFLITAPTTVTITSTGYAGGGFDPVLSLYDSTGFNIDSNDDQATGVSDSQLVSPLAKGKYLVYLTQYDNFGPASLGLPFNFDDQPDFRGGFVDFSGNQRTGNWALDISGAAVSGAVPEPSTWAMLIVGFGLVGAVSRRRAAVAA
jgi:PEP-CTERM motif